MKYEGGYYHVYNRGVDKRKVFNTEKDYKRFLQSLIEFNTVNPIGSIREVNRYKVLENSTVSRPPRSADADLGGLETTVSLVKIYAYCLLPNHFHLLVKEEQEKGVGRFMSKVGNGYTKYFNIINNRSGFLFQGKYKKKLIDNENYLAYLTAYINCNSEIHEIKKA
ncbi:hypothetical protein C0583_00980 [Candidatus Parcubacteria bacterium]|nr:MAG: hypothetical protein C0583_00980 [Candidatus Parcubacteria bacterium]